MSPKEVLQLAKDNHAEQMDIRFTDIPGIRVGHVSDYEAITGCTAILCEQAIEVLARLQGFLDAVPLADIPQK